MSQYGIRTALSVIPSKNPVITTPAPNRKDVLNTSGTRLFFLGKYCPSNLNKNGKLTFKKGLQAVVPYASII